MSDISFTSGIRAIPIQTFNKNITQIGKQHSVNYPWTIDQAVKASEAYTTNILDCTMAGITDGQNVLMLHLCPTINRNHNSFDIQQFIAHNMDMKSPNLQAIIIGSKINKLSQDIYTKIKEIIAHFNIPLSELKIGKDSLNVSYSSKNDEWLISSLAIDKQLKKGLKSSEVLTNNFNEINVASCDELV